MGLISFQETNMCTGKTHWWSYMTRVCTYWTLVGSCLKKETKKASVLFLQSYRWITTSNIFVFRVQGWWGGINVFSLCVDSGGQRDDGTSQDGVFVFRIHLFDSHSNCHHIRVAHALGPTFTLMPNSYSPDTTSDINNDHELCFTFSTLLCKSVSHHMWLTGMQIFPGLLVFFDTNLSRVA